MIDRITELKNKTMKTETDIKINPDAHLLENAVSGSTGSERIICAANYYNDGQTEVHSCKNIEVGFVICGHRHHNCIGTFAKMVGFPYSDESHKLQDTEIQGFLTSKNRFVTREEGLIIALRENQVMDIKEIRGNRLFSEDLY